MVKYLDNSSGFAQWNAARNAQNTKKPLGFSKFLWYFVLVMFAWWVVSALFAPKRDTFEASDTVSVVDISDVPVNEISSDKLNAQVQGLRVSNIALTDFGADSAKPDDTARVTLLGDEQEFIEIGLVGTSAGAPSATTVWKNGDADNTYTWHDKSGVNFVRSIVTDGYLITVTDTIENKTVAPVSFSPYARIVRGIGQSQKVSGVDTGMIAYVNSSTEDAHWTKLDQKSYAYSTTNGFIGFADQYWETVINIDMPDQTLRARKVGDKYQADASAAPVNIAPGATQTINTIIFAGPRDQRVLNSVSGMITGIDKTIDYGWFWFLARPMLWLLNMLNSIVMNYGLAIILMTLLLRILMWPLTRKSYTSMIAMQKMQPELAKIQSLYANDKTRMQMEMMRLYQTHKTSPMSGCLPMLIQIPIFFALYKALLVSVQMRSAHFLWISDLATMDPYFILPVLMGGTMWLQQHLQSGAQKSVTGNGTVAQTQRVMKWMPLIFTVMFAWMPAGLVLYWTVSNIFGIAQMYIIKRTENHK